MHKAREARSAGQFYLLDAERAFDTLVCATPVLFAAESLFAFESERQLDEFKTAFWAGGNLV
jgi:hypothetical protein